MNEYKRVMRELVPISEDDFFIVLNHSNAKFDFPLHFHPELELNLVLNSSGKRIIGDSILNYNSCDLVLVGANTPHTWIGTEGKAQVVTIQFHQHFLATESLNKKLMLSIKEMLERSKRGILFSDETIQRLKPRILELSETQDFDSLLKFLSILYDLSIARNTKMLASHSYVDYYRISKSRRIEKVNNYVQKNLNQKITLSDVASLVNMSETAFSHFFKKSTNTSFTDYLNDLRLGHAARLLTETEMTISEICFDSGFNNVSNFNRTFKKKIGFTPTGFRTQQKLITKH